MDDSVTISLTYDTKFYNAYKLVYHTGTNYTTSKSVPQDHLIPRASQEEEHDEEHDESVSPCL